MISDTDRSYWFGASDSLKVLTPNHTTKTWNDWWNEKCGVGERDFKGNIYTQAGERYEHPILEAFDKDIYKDRQLYVEDLRLRVNYDGDKDGIIYEVKTHRRKNAFEITPYIYAQIQTQMYVWKEAGDVPFKKLYILSYGLSDEELHDPNPVVDPDRIKVHKTKYDKGHVKRFLQELEPLVERLDEMRKPSIMQDEKVCFLTGATENLDCHHIYHGWGNRRISDENGLWVWLAHDWHIADSENHTPHNDTDVDLYLKKECQKVFEKTHSREEFISLVGRNYLD